MSLLSRLLCLSASVTVNQLLNTNHHVTISTATGNDFFSFFSQGQFYLPLRSNRNKVDQRTCCFRGDRMAESGNKSWSDIKCRSDSERSPSGPLCVWRVLLQRHVIRRGVLAARVQGPASKDPPAAYICRHSNRHTRARTRARTRTHKHHAPAHTQVPTHTHTHTHTTHTLTHTHTYTHTHTHIHSHTHNACTLVPPHKLVRLIHTVHCVVCPFR